MESYFNSRGLFKAFDPRSLQHYLEHGLERHGDGWRLRFRPEVEVAVFRETPTGVTSPRLKVPGALVTGEKSPQLFHKGGARHARRHRMKRLFAPGSHMYPLERPRAPPSWSRASSTICSAPITGRAAMTETPRERRFSAFGQTLAGLQWDGDGEALPVLALHGWLDNAASFQPLAEHLGRPWWPWISPATAIPIIARRTRPPITWTMCATCWRWPMNWVGTASS